MAGFLLCSTFFLALTSASQVLSRMLEYFAALAKLLSGFYSARIDAILDSAPLRSVQPREIQPAQGAFMSKSQSIPSFDSSDLKDLKQKLIDGCHILDR